MMAFLLKNFILVREMKVYIFAQNMEDHRKFEEGSTCLVLASEKYTKDDYIFDYKEFTSR